MEKWLPAIVWALLGSGGLAFITTFFKGLTAIRSGMRAREREAIDDLGEQRRDAARDRDYWRNVAYRYQGQLLRADIEPNPAEPIPPSERDTDVWRERPRRGARHALPEVEEGPSRG